MSERLYLEGGQKMKPTQLQRGDVITFDIENGLVSFSREAARLLFSYDGKTYDNKKIIAGVKTEAQVFQVIALIAIIANCGHEEVDNQQGKIRHRFL